MANFCKECSLALFGEDTKDFTNLAEKDEYVQVLCEGCGPIIVNNLGVRWSKKLDPKELEDWFSGFDVDMYPRNFQQDPIKLYR